MTSEDPQDPTRQGSRGDDVHVRPVGFVEADAVVRQVGDRDLYLGNCHAADPARCEHSFDAVLSLTATECPRTTHHHPLVDGEGNDWATFAAPVDEARALSREDGRVLVHCKAGVSRSAAVLATAIAAEEDRSFSAARSLVVEARPHAVVNPALCELGVAYLAADRRVECHVDVRPGG